MATDDNKPFAPCLKANNVFFNPEIGAESNAYWKCRHLLQHFNAPAKLDFHVRIKGEFRSLDITECNFDCEQFIIVNLGKKHFKKTECYLCTDKCASSFVGEKWSVCCDCNKLWLKYAAQYPLYLHRPKFARFCELTKYKFSNDFEREFFYERYQLMTMVHCYDVMTRNARVDKRKKLFGYHTSDDNCGDLTRQHDYYDDAEMRVRDEKSDETLAAAITQDDVKEMDALMSSVSHNK